jgi:Fe-S-cluster containining protein
MKGRRLFPRGELDLDRADHRLLQVVDGALAEATEAARRTAPPGGSWLACRVGCTECCHGPFPVNPLDLRRLRQGLAELAVREPERAAAVIERARAQFPVLREGFPGNWETGILDEDDEAADPYFTRHGSLPCPVLDPATGHCDLYAHRPLTCRTFGPPVQIGESLLPPCRLCFQGAPAETVEACRMEPDPHGLEDRLLARLGDEETIIAIAVASRKDSL